MIDKRQLRFMGDGAAYAYLAMQQAIADAGLEEGDVSNERTGLIAGSGGPSTQQHVRGAPHGDREGQPEADGAVHGDALHVLDGLGLPRDAVQDQGASTTRSPRPARPARTASATASSRSSGASRTSSSPAAARSSTGRCRCLFDAMGAMSTKYNDQPEKALARLRRRPRRLRDRRRRRHGGARGARARPGPRREDLRRGHRLRRHLGRRTTWWRPRASAASGRCGWRSSTLPAGRKVGYINAHGTSTPVGDVSEVRGGAPGVRRGPDAADQLDQVDDRPQPGRDRRAGGDLLPADAARRLHRRPRSTSRRSTRRCGPGEIATARVDDAGLDTVMTNSFGFGGTNASLLLSRHDG